MHPLNLRLALASMAVATLAWLPAAAQTESERILSFHSDIVVYADASMGVAETIKVRARGAEIKRGIYRDFPTTYRDSLGNQYVVDFDVQRVLRDGRPEPYHLEGLSNGVRVYIGQSDVLLTPGEYTYTIEYRTSRQIGYFADHDELYWNVTGTGWTFPIDEASARVVLPDGVAQDRIALEGYTGPQGARGKDFRSAVDDSGAATFTTTRPLRPREGITIVVSWPKGVVAAPTSQQRLGYFLHDNRAAVVGLIGLALLLAYYLLVWARVGKDPSRGTVIPLYTPPDGLSPAATRFIIEMGFDPKVFSATVINMAVKGYLTIVEHDGWFARRGYTIGRGPADRSVLTPEEEALADALLRRDDSIELKNENHVRIQAALRALQKHLERGFGKGYFHTNAGYFALGLVVSAATMVAVAAAAGSFPALVLLGTFACAVPLAVSAVKRFASRGGFAQVIGIGFSSVFLIVFGLIFLLAEPPAAPVVLALLALALGVVNVIFYHLLKAPTAAGREMLDKIEGFKQYLSVAERERLNLLNPPERTPALFEKYLPYALALGVEQAWSEQFSDVLAAAGSDGQAYAPLWYSGTGWSDSNVSDFSSSLGGSLTGAIASSSTAPSSSSGSGGGGSSGGGGGGGGGGGW